MAKINPRQKKTQINKVTLMDFSATHFKGIRFESDSFYTSLSNRLYDIIQQAIGGSMAPEYIKRLAINLACYVEDLVSGCGVWSAFTSLHEKKYGRKLPFFNLDKPAIPVPYDDELPSLHAVQFLIWYTLNGAKPDTVMSPLNPALSMLSIRLMPELTDAYENAPDSPARPAIMPEEEAGVPLFFQIRNLCSWLCTRCYLTRVNDMQSVSADYKAFISHLLDNIKSPDKKGQTEYAVQSFVPMNAHIGPLAIPAYEWLAEIVDLYHEEEEEQYLPLLREIKSLPYQYYKYKKVDTQTAILVSLEGQEMSMSATTLPGEKFSSEVKEGMSALMSLVWFDGAWVMNSIGLQALPEEAYDTALKNYREKQDNDNNTYHYLMKNLKNKRLGVYADYKEYMAKAYPDKPRNENIPPEIIRDLEECDNMVYFINSDGTTTILPGWATCIKLRGNKFYDKAEATVDGISLICNQSMTTPEMRQYMIDNKMLADAAMNSIISETAGRRLFQENIRFFNDYYSRDSMKYFIL
ncbi:MAG: DUF3843 family protein [Duncaniella sp.]|nr:DUF3843 family protein [Duncaniella sp.]